MADINKNISFLEGNDVVYLRYLSSGDGTTSLTGTMNDAQSLSALEQRVCILHLINLSSYTFLFQIDQSRNVIRKRRYNNQKWCVTNKIFTSSTTYVVSTLLLDININATIN